MQKEKYICNDCPRKCNVDRNKKTGFCGEGKEVALAKVVSPFCFEEPILGKLSAFFFYGCNLRCSYCQNFDISRVSCDKRNEKKYNPKELAALFDGAIGGIDLVTPTHFAREIQKALLLCKTKKKVVWNTSSYEKSDMVKLEAEFTDIFLADFRYKDGEISKKFSLCPDYFSVAKKAIKLMREKKDVIEKTPEGEVMSSGLIVRILVLPNCVKDALDILDFIAGELGTDTYVSLMSQFTPNGMGEPTRRLKPIEYKVACEHAVKLGFCNGYFQDFSSADGKYTPKFSGE